VKRGKIGPHRERGGSDHATVFLNTTKKAQGARVRGGGEKILEPMAISGERGRAIWGKRAISAAGEKRESNNNNGKGEDRCLPEGKKGWQSAAKERG